MKKALTVALLTLASTAAMAQVNIQAHYDFGRKAYPDAEATRQNMTVTFEQFRPDRLGNIFYFIDLDFYAKGMKGAYMEFSREFNIGKKGFAVHGEYNGGMTTGKNETYASQFQHALLLGPVYNGHNSDYSFTWSVQALYKQYFKGLNHSAFPSLQLTGVWGWTFGNEDMFTFSGYIDFWRNPKPTTGSYAVTIQTEPQLWFNLNSVTKKKTNLSIGTEWELSNNFIFPESGTKTFYLNPTLGLKWTMN